jgi:hypothetical protein
LSLTNVDGIFEKSLFMKITYDENTKEPKWDESLVF